MNRKIKDNAKEVIRNAGRLLLCTLKGVRGSLCGILLLYGTIAFSQDIGDHTLPMKSSIHTYTVTMGNISNSVLWNIYDSTATRERIDAGLVTPFSKTTDYLVNAQGIAAGAANITIEFSGNLQVGRLYRLAYREESADHCYIYQFLNFRLQSPIDVDVEQANADQCPDSDQDYLEDPNPADAVYYPTLQSVLEFHVIMRNDTYDPPATNWHFNYEIIVAGQSGASATIQEVLYPGYTDAPLPLASTYSRSANIPVVTKDVQFLVTINDVPGVRQRIDFKLDQIEGAYSERDIDVIVPLAGQNELVHYVNAIPAASYIAALD
jgi:hypothetical protein